MTWEGWLAFSIFLGLVVAGSFIVPPRHSLAGYVAYVALVAVLFAAVCWWKGEPARWRWGGD